MANNFQKLSLNLWVDLSNATTNPNYLNYTANGRFLPFPTNVTTQTPPYTASKAWVMEVNSVPEFYCTRTGDCSGKDSDKGAPIVAPLASGSTGNQPLVWVRVNAILGPAGGPNTFALGDSIAGPGGPGAIRITVVIGRSHKTNQLIQQKYASPFPLVQTAGNPLCTVMDWCFSTTSPQSQPFVENIQNFTTDGTQVWCGLGLGYPMNQFYSGSGVDNYSVVVGVTIAPQTGSAVTLGHDPDFDVGM
jgi:hypothetical protein